jgi:transformation/transcription domain-associated protein
MELWLMRKQFTLQVAAISFMSYILMMGGRHPQKIAISKSTGMIYSAELTPCMWFLGIRVQKLTRLPAVGAAQPMLVANEPVPFRFTRNMQEFMTDAGIEGLLTAGVNAIARCLTEPEVRMFSFACVH